MGKYYYRDVTRTVTCTKVKYLDDNGCEQTQYVVGKFFFDEIRIMADFENKRIVDTRIVKCQFKATLKEFAKIAECEEVDY